MRSKQCFNCVHRVRTGTADRLVCLAFQDGIPEGILTGEIDHTQPYPGDNGFRYVPEEEGLDADGQ